MDLCIARKILQKRYNYSVYKEKKTQSETKKIFYNKEKKMLSTNRRLGYNKRQTNTT